MPKRGPRTTGAQVTILRELTRRTGQIVYLNDLMTWTTFDKKVIQSALTPSRLARLSEDIRVVAQGRAWRHVGPKSESVEKPAEIQTHDIVSPYPVDLDVNTMYGKLARNKLLKWNKPEPGEKFEVLGQSDNGDMILRDAEGALWRATKL